MAITYRWTGWQQHNAKCSTVKMQKKTMSPKTQGALVFLWRMSGQKKKPLFLVQYLQWLQRTNIEQTFCCVLTSPSTRLKTSKLKRLKIRGFFIFYIKLRSFLWVCFLSMSLPKQCKGGFLGLACHCASTLEGSRSIETTAVSHSDLYIRRQSNKSASKLGT